MSLETGNINEIYNLLKSTHIAFTENLINIYMVYYGYRSSCLIEPVNYNNDLNLSNRLLAVVDLLKLHFKYDNIGRIIITKNKINVNINLDKDIGKLLGFYCIDHNYSNFNIDRSFAQINIVLDDIKLNVYAEVCEKSKLNINEFKKHIDYLTDKYKVLFKNSTLFKIYSEIENEDSLNTRVNNIIDKNKDYIKQNINNYNNDMSNFFSSKWIDISADEFLTPIHSKLYKLSVNDDFTKIYPKFTGSNFNEIYDISIKFMEYYHRLKNIDDQIIKLKNYFPEFFNILKSQHIKH